MLILADDIGAKLSDFDILRELGRGSYGVVFLVRSLLDSKLYVLKKMPFKPGKNNKKQKDAL